MFGRSEWFRATKTAVGLQPIRREGWVYVGTWLAVMGLPGMFLLGQAKVLETAIWLAVTGGLLAWDWKQLRTRLTTKRDGKSATAASASAAPDDDVFVIDENETESARFATRQFELHCRH